MFTIATGTHTWSEIKGNVDRSAGASRPAIEWLQNLDLVARGINDELLLGDVHYFGGDDLLRNASLIDE